MNSNHNQASDGEAKAKPEVIKLGLDLHARQVTECRQLDGSTPKPAQKWDPWKLLNQVEEWVKSGIKVYSCYEAGACGYWYHRELIKCGAVNCVVAPRPLENQRSKHQKTDRSPLGVSIERTTICSKKFAWRTAARPITTFSSTLSPLKSAGNQTGYISADSWSSVFANTTELVVL